MRRIDLDEGEVVVTRLIRKRHRSDPPVVGVGQYVADDR